MNKRRAGIELANSLRQVGIPQTKAALRLRISLPYLNRILAGEREPSDEVHGRILELTRQLKSSGLMGDVG